MLQPSWLQRHLGSVLSSQSPNSRTSVSFKPTNHYLTSPYHAVSLKLLIILFLPVLENSSPLWGWQSTLSINLLYDLLGPKKNKDFSQYPMTVTFDVWPTVCSFPSPLVSVLGLPPWKPLNPVATHHPSAMASAVALWRALPSHELPRSSSASFYWLPQWSYPPSNLFSLLVLLTPPSASLPVCPPIFPGPPWPVFPISSSSSWVLVLL